jgi:thioredoxin reductase
MAETFDVIVVGGGPAGLSAALVLGRARQRTLVVDSGQGRNATAAAAQGVFTRDGTPPAELRAIGREQLRPYGVAVREGDATDARSIATGLEVALADGTTIRSRKLLLATGLRDELPPIPGLAERWGHGVVGCPFCHGWELRDRPIAVYGQGPHWLDHAVLVRNWSRDLIVCTDGPSELPAEEQGRLESLEIPLREERIAALIGPAPELSGILLVGGEMLPREALFFRAASTQRSVLADRLGCELTEHGRIAADEWGRTSVPNVSAAGDAASLREQVVAAAASGALAAISLVRDLVVLG